MGEVILVADGSNGILTIDPGPPAAIVNTLSLGGSVTRLDVSGSLVACSGSAFLVVDFLNPLAPIIRGSLPSPPAEDVRLIDNLAFLAGQDSLRIVDVSVPSSPYVVGSFDEPGLGGFSSVDGLGGFLYLLEPTLSPPLPDAGRVHILNVSNPANPVRVGTISSAHGFELTVSDSKLLLSGETYFDLRVFDLGVDPVAPPELIATSFTNGAGHHFCHGDQVFVVGSSPGVRSIHVVDVSNFDTAPVAGEFPGFSGSMCTSGTLLYLGGFNTHRFLQVLDISVSASPVLLGEVSIGSVVRGMDVEGTRVLAAAGTAGLYIVESANPAAPSIIGNVNTPGTAESVAQYQNYAFVADGNSGISVVDVQFPWAPVIVHQFATDGYASDVDVHGSELLVCNGSAGLQLFDVANPLAPSMSGSLDTPGEAIRMQRSGNLVYIADGFEGGLQIADVSNSSAPTLRGGCDTPGTSRTVFNQGVYVYVADGNEGITIIDARNPTFPSPVGSHLGIPANACVVAGNVLLATQGSVLRTGAVQCATSSVENPPFNNPNSLIRLDAALPNPARHTASLMLHLTRDTHVNAFVADLNGRLVCRLWDGLRSAGSNELRWNGCDTRGARVRTGVYFVKVLAGGVSQTQRIVLMP
jgi:hypothetical protein